MFTIVRLIDLLIPDIPEKLEALIHLEDSFAREMMKEVIEVRVKLLPRNFVANFISFNLQQKSFNLEI